MNIGLMDEQAATAAAQVASGLRGTTEDERWLMGHISMWGSEAYPVEKRGRGWSIRQVRSVQGPRYVFKTKREAVAQFEAFMDTLIDAIAGRI